MDAWFAAPIGALLIFTIRLVDVSMSVVRMILAVRGHRALAAGIGFFEVLLWLVAAGHALQNLNSVLHVIGYAGGFAAGNYAGIWLESWLAPGTSVVRAVYRRTREAEPAAQAARAAERLRHRGFAVTEIEGRGLRGDVEILDAVVSRRQVSDVMEIIRETAPDAFVTVEDVRAAHGGLVRPGGRKFPFLTHTGRDAMR